MNFKRVGLYGLDVCAALMFSGLFIVTPLAIAGIGAVGLATQRFVPAAMIFVAVFATQLVRCEKIGRHHWPWLALAAFLGIFSYNICLFHGIALSGVIHGGLIVGFTPIMTLFLEALVFRMRLSAVKLLGAGISLLGVFYFFWSRLDGMAFTALKGNTEFAGDLLFLLAGLCRAGYSLAMRRVTALLNPLVATGCSVIVGAIMLLIWSAISLDHMPISLAMFTLPVLYMAIFGTVIAFLIWFNSVDRRGADQHFSQFRSHLHRGSGLERSRRRTDRHHPVIARHGHFRGSAGATLGYEYGASTPCAAGRETTIGREMRPSMRLPWT